MANQCGEVKEVKAKWIVHISILVLVLINIQLTFDFKLIELEEGSKVVFTNPFGRHTTGGAPNHDFYLQLSEVYGENDAFIERFNGVIDGKNIVVTDHPIYLFGYLGRDMKGHYASCTVITKRVLDIGGIKETEKRISKYIGFDDGDPNSIERAKILWDTLKETYSNSEESFKRYE